MHLSRFLSLLLLLIVAALISIGLITAYSATVESAGTQMLIKQSIWVGLGIVSCIALMLIPLEWLVSHAHIFLIGCGLLLLYLFIGVILHAIGGSQFISHMPFISGETKGSFRWLQFGGCSLQPSEFAKCTLILFLAAYYGSRPDSQLIRFKQGILLPFFCMTGPVLALILLGKDLSTTVLTAFVALGMMFCAGVRLRYLLLIGLLCMLGGGLMLFSSPERLSRISGQKNVEANKQGDSFQLYTSQLALGGGGLTGRGFGNGLMKAGYLPERHTDFILAVWGEEIGFCGIFLVMLLYLCLTACLFTIGLMSKDRIGMLICLGTCFLISSQALLNIGVVIGFLPTTGVTAPFLSYGGSSMLSLLLCMGLVANVCRRNIRSSQTAGKPGANYPTYQELHDAQPNQ